MSTTVDNRVVQMQFDNSKFESNVQTSLGTINKLKNALNFKGASDGLSDVSSAAKGVNMSYLANGIETVRMKFSALQVMGVAVLTNIANSAFNAGKRIVSALAIDPITTGFQEYETKINAIQTIMSNTASKGSTMDDVNKVLDELNTYADKTIYNFTEMTRNIGTFTAAGVGLEDAASAIQGIANLAAASGSTSQQASTAMYQLSQALASGTVKLQDWNSVVNAGMGGQLFQEALKNTAREAGVDIDKIIKKSGSFRESLQKGWLTADILNTTLKKFTTDGAKEYAQSMVESGKWTQAQADALMKEAQSMEDAATKVKTFTQLWDTLKEAAQSGWTNTWQLILGDFEEAKEFFTGLSDLFGGIINASAEARNKLLGKSLGDRTLNLPIDDLVMFQKEADKAGKSLDELLKERGYKNGREFLLESLMNILESIGSIIKPIKEAFKDIFPTITAQRLFDLIKGFNEFTSKLKLSDEQSAKLKSTFKGLFAIVDIIATVIKKFAGGVIELIKNFKGLGTGILGITGSMGDWLINLRDSIKESDIFGKAINGIVGFLQKGIDKVKEFVIAIKGKIKTPGFDAFISILKSIWNFTKKIGAKIGEVLSSIGKGLVSALRNGDIKSLLDSVNVGILGAILLKFKNFIGSLADSVGSAGGFLDNIKGVLNSVKDSLEAWQNDLKAGTLIKIATAIGILAASLWVLSSIDPAKLASALTGMAVLFGELVGAMTLVSKIKGLTRDSMKVVAAMIPMAVAILILSAALKNLSDISWEGLAKGIIGIAVLTDIIVRAAKRMRTTSKDVIKGASQMIIMAAAIKILASACKDLSSLSWEELGKGLVGVIVLMTSVSKFLSKTSFSHGVLSNAIGIVVLSGAIKILATCVKDFGSMKWEDLIRGLTAVGAILIEISMFSQATQNTTGMISTGISIGIIAASMQLFYNAVKGFASMSWESLIQGLAGMGGALIIIALAIGYMPKDSLLIASGLAVMSVALIGIAYAFEKLGSMSYEEVGKGIVALGSSLGLLAIALKAMNGTLGGSASLVVAVAALGLLTPILIALGSMSWETIVKGLVALGGALTIIGSAGMALAPIAPSLLALAGAFALFGLAMAAVGIGIGALAAGLTMLAGMTAATAASIVGSLKILIVGFLDIIPTIITSIVDGIARSAESIGAALKALISIAVDAIVECAPQIVDGALKMLSEVLNSLAAYTPQLIDSLFDFVINLLTGVAARAPELISSIMEVITSVFGGILEALGAMDFNTVVKTVSGFGLVIGLIALLGTIVPLIPGAMVGVLGLAAVIAEMGFAVAALGALAQLPGLNWLIGEGGKFLQILGRAIGGFIGGIAGGIAEGATASLPNIGTNLSTFMTNLQPFLDAAKSVDASSLTGVQTIASIITELTTANILEGIGKFITGSTSMETFATQLIGLGNALSGFTSSTSNLGEEDISKINAIGLASQALVNVADEVPETGGLVQAVTGTPDLVLFANGISALGPAIATLSASIQDVSEGTLDKISGLAEAITPMVELADKVPKTGGLTQAIAGTPDLVSFATGLTELGTSIGSFSESVKEVTTDDATKMTNLSSAVSSMVELAGKVPETGGLKQAITGAPDLKTFADQLSSMGGSIKTLSDSVKEVSIDDITKINTLGIALQTLSAVALSVNAYNSGTVLNTNMTEFATELVGFADKVKEFTDKFDGLDTAVVTRVSIIATKMTSIATTASEGSYTSLADFGQALVDFGNDINTFITAMSALSGNQATQAIDNCQNLVTSINGMANSDISGIKGMSNVLSEAGENAVNSFLQAFTGASGKARQASERLVTSIMQGINSKVGSLINSFRNALSKMIAAVNSYQGNFKNAGGNLVSGFANGITASTFKAAAAARAMAEKALTAAKEALDINSPSRAFYKIGDYAGKGFINAFDDYGTRSYKAGAAMAEKAKSGLSRAIAKVSDVLANDIDNQPTIRPVLDLSNIKNGAGAIGSMLGMEPSIGLMSNINAISSTLHTNQNGSNYDIISAIKDLGDKLGASSGDTYNFDGITYDDGSNVNNAVKTLVRAVKVERRI